MKLLATQAQQPNSQPNQFSIPPELLTGGGYLVGFTILAYVFLKNYVENSNKRSQIDNDSTQKVNETLRQQQIDSFDDMRKERVRVIEALERNTTVMQEFTIILKRVESVLEKFAS